MQRLEVSGAVRPIYVSLGFKRLIGTGDTFCVCRTPNAYICTVGTGRVAPENQCLIYNNNIYLLQLGCNPVAVVILHVYKT